VNVPGLVVGAFAAMFGCSPAIAGFKVDVLAHSLLVLEQKVRPFPSDVALIIVGCQRPSFSSIGKDPS
jgi:hypothetical protein